MKLITAIVQPQALEDVVEALRTGGVHGMTITEVFGHGAQGGHTEVYRGSEYRIDTMPKVKLEIVATADDEPAIIERIVGAARSGNIGDGKVWSTDVGHIVRVRTGDVGAAAL